MDFILKGDWIRESPHKKDASLAGALNLPRCSISEGGSLHAAPGGLSRGRVPSPCPSNVAVGAKLLQVDDNCDLVVDQTQMEIKRSGSARDLRSPRQIEQQLKRALENEQKQKQRTENLKKLVDHQGNIISSLQQQLAVVEADLAREKSCQQKQNFSATSSPSSTSHSPSPSTSESRWSASAELSVQVTHRTVQCDFPSDSGDNVMEKLKQLSEDREALRTDVRELVQEKRFWQEKCRLVLEQMQSLEEKDKVLRTEKSLMSKSCSELSKELEDLKGRYAEHENCNTLRDSSGKEIERLTNLANCVSNERKGLQDQIGYLQSRMQNHLDKFTQLKAELKGALKERDSASARTEAAIQDAQHLQADRDLWKERCNAALSELQQTHLFHEELGKVHINSQQEAESYQDELVTLRAALRTQAGDVAKWENEAYAWQQRAEQFAAAMDQARERMQVRMSELNQQLESRDRIIQQQKQRLTKMPQIQADLEVLRTELKRAIAAVSESCASSTEVSPSPPVSTDVISLNVGGTVSSTCCYCKKTELADSSASTVECHVLLVDNSTSTSDVPVCFAESSTSTFENPVDTTNSSTSTSEDTPTAAEVDVEFELSDIFDSNFSLLDVSVEKLGELLKGGGDSRVRHIETQTDLTRESAGKGDEVCGSLKIPVQEDLALEIASHALPVDESETDAEERLNLEAENRRSFEDRLEIQKIHLEDSVLASTSVLIEVLSRVDDVIKSKAVEDLKLQEWEVEDLKLQEVTSERDTLEVLLQKETSARFAVSKRLEDAESKLKRLAEEQQLAVERCESREVEFSDKMAEVRWELEAEKKRSSDFKRNIADLETSLNEEKSRSAMFEKEMVKLGRVLAEMTFWSNCLQSAVSAKTKKYAEAVKTFRFVSLCLRKEMSRRVKKVDKVNKLISSGNEYARKFFIARPLKRLRGGIVGRRKRCNAGDIASVLRRRVKQSIWHSVVIQESSDVKCGGKFLRVVRRRRQRRSFGIVWSELKKNVTLLKLHHDKANGMVDDLSNRVAQLESENQDLLEEKSLLEKKFVAEDERETRIQALTEELAAAHNVNLQLKQQIQRVFVSLRADLEAKLHNHRESKGDEKKKKGVLPLHNEIIRVQEDLEKERNRTVGARKDAADFNNWFHVLVDYVRSQPMSSCDDDCSESRDVPFLEIPRPREGVKSKEAFSPSCTHQDGTGCCAGLPPNRECQLCFLKAQQVYGSNAGWASRTVHLAHECARRINQQAMAHQAALASFTAAHQREMAAMRDAHSLSLMRVQSKQSAELARVRREVRTELEASLRTEVRANMNAVVERSLAEVEHLHRAEMRKLTRSLSSPLKFRIGRLAAETGQPEVGYQPALNDHISLRSPLESDQQHVRQIALVSPNPEFGEWLDSAADVLSRIEDKSYRHASASPQHLTLGNGVAEERVKLWKLNRELQAEREEASRLLMVLGGQWAALRIRQAYLQAWADVDKNAA